MLRKIAYNSYLFLLSGLLAGGILWLIFHGIGIELIVVVLCGFLGLIACVRQCCAPQPEQTFIMQSHGSPQSQNQNQNQTQINNPVYISPRPAPFVLIINSERAISIGILHPIDRSSI